MVTTDADHIYTTSQKVNVLCLNISRSAWQNLQIIIALHILNSTKFFLGNYCQNRTAQFGSQKPRKHNRNVSQMNDYARHKHYKKADLSPKHTNKGLLWLQSCLTAQNINVLSL